MMYVSIYIAGFLLTGMLYSYLSGRKGWRVGDDLPPTSVAAIFWIITLPIFAFGDFAMWASESYIKWLRGSKK